MADDLHNPAPSRASWVAQFKLRLHGLAVAVIQVTRVFPRTVEARIIAEQAIRSAASVAANYRAGCRARTSRELRAKLGVVAEEADETAFWLELAIACDLVPRERAQPLIVEAYEVVAIVSTSRRTLRSRI